MNPEPPVREPLAVEDVQGLQENQGPLDYLARPNSTEHPVYLESQELKAQPVRQENQELREPMVSFVCVC